MNYQDINIYKLGIESILNPYHGWHRGIDEFFKLVKQTGYPYFMWQGELYKVNNFQDGYMKLDTTIEDIRERDLKLP